MSPHSAQMSFKKLSWVGGEEWNWAREGNLHANSREIFPPEHYRTTATYARASFICSTPPKVHRYSYQVIVRYEDKAVGEVSY
jgi:hypothetical protein